MKPGDIVYFKSEYKAQYSNQGGPYEYYFKPGDRYRIEDDIFSVSETVMRQLYLDLGFGVRTGRILNLEDGKLHFAHSEIWDRLITIDEYRKLQLDKLGI
jgi:hypothetical protein